MFGLAWLPRRSRASWLAWLGLLTVASGADALAPPIAAAEDTWVEVRTPSFVVFANTGERKARDVALSFERFRQALRLLRPESSHQHPVPLRVIVFDDDASFGPYKLHRGGRGTLVGQFQHGTWADYILLNAFPRQGEALPVVYHEYVHAFLRTNFSGVPLWLEEGLAELASTFSTTETSFVVGLPSPERLRALREHPFMPLAELFAVDAQSPAYREDGRAGLFYAQSWLLVHYVAMGGRERVAQLESFLAALRDGTPAEDACRAAFGRTTAELGLDLRRYLHAATFPFLRFPGAMLGAEPAVAVRPTPTGEALYELGTALALRGPETADAARAHLEAAATAGIPDAWASLGLVAEERGHAEAAAVLYDRSAREGAARPVSLVLQAKAMLRADATVQSARQARERLRRALELQPGYAEAQALLGHSYLLEDLPVDEGIGALTTALARLPGRADLAYDLALLLLRKGDIAGAEHLVRTIVTPLGSARLASNAQRALERARVKAAVDAALAAGDLARTDVVLRAALAATSDPALRTDLEVRLQRLAAHLASVERFARLRTVTAAAKGGDLANVERQLSALRQEANEPSLLLAIDDVLGRIAQSRRR